MALILLLIAVLVVGLAGLVLSIVPVIADILCGRRAALRQHVRAAFVTAHVAFGISVHRWLGTAYVRDLARYDPDNCGRYEICQPVDGRLVWIIFWVGAGIVAAVMVLAVHSWRAERGAKVAPVARCDGPQR